MKKLVAISRKSAVALIATLIGVVGGYFLITATIANNNYNNISAEESGKKEQQFVNIDEQEHMDHAEEDNYDKEMNEQELNTDANILSAPEFNNVDQYINTYLNEFQSESLNGAATRYDYDLHLVTSSGAYAKHFAALSNDEEQIKKLNEIAEIGNISFSADPETVEGRKQEMAEALSDF